MTQVKVYRNMGNFPRLEFRSYREGLEEWLRNGTDSMKAGAKLGLAILEKFGQAAPEKYGEIWNGNPILNSVYAYLSKPSQGELEKSYWAEISVNPKRCVVAPHLLAGEIVSLRRAEKIPEYWNNSHILENFLQEYKPTGKVNCRSSWENKKSGEIYEIPELLIPLDAIDMKGSSMVKEGAVER